MASPVFGALRESRLDGELHGSTFRVALGCYEDPTGIYPNERPVAEGPGQMQAERERRGVLAQTLPTVLPTSRTAAPVPQKSSIEYSTVKRSRWSGALTLP
jgi:hypothetical protein